MRFLPDLHSKTSRAEGQKLLTDVEVNWSKLYFRNIRNMDHAKRKAHYTSMKLNLSKLKSADFINVPFSRGSMFSHPMIQFNFEDGKEIVLSVEARKQPGTRFNRMAWIFRSYGLIFQRWTPEDLIGLRKDFRKNRVFNYRLKLTKKQLQDIMLTYIDTTQNLLKKPQFYHTIYSQCGNNLRIPISKITKKGFSRDARAIIWTYMDWMLYNLWLIDNSKPFKKIRKKAQM